MNNFEKELACSWIEDEDSTVDWLGSQVSLTCFVDGYSVYISVINEPNDLIGEQFSIVL
jgi:hypothetical protein